MGGTVLKDTRELRYLAVVAVAAALGAVIGEKIRPTLKSIFRAR